MPSAGEGQLKSLGRLPCVLAAAALMLPAAAGAQAAAAWGQISLFGYGSRFTSGSQTNPATSGDFSAAVMMRSAANDEGGLEYGLDMRGLSATSTGADTMNRLYLYDAFLGARTRGGTLGLRVGQMFLNDLGGLGSLGGALVEIRPSSLGSFGRPRIGLFGGLEPKNFDAGYVADVRKYGGYLAIDGEGARRHVIGYVTIRNGGLVERSVLTMTNFIPVGQKFFLYQAAEYDLSGPAGLAKGGLNYIFATARYAPIRLIEFQGTYHRGLSIDTRTVTDDQRNGRPVDSRSLQGFLFESAGGRITVEPVRGLRLFGGFERDRNNQHDLLSTRLTAGLYYYNLLKTGFDVSATGYHTNSPNGQAGSYDSLFASIGRSLGSFAYVSADYSSALSVLQFQPGGGVQVQNLPRSRHYAVSGLVHLSRHFSLLVSGEQTRQGDTTETRATLGLTYRFY